MCIIDKVSARFLMGPAKFCLLPRKEKFVENAQRLTLRQGGKSRLDEVLSDYSNLDTHQQMQRGQYAEYPVAQWLGDKHLGSLWVLAVVLWNELYYILLLVYSRGLHGRVEG